MATSAKTSPRSARLNRSVRSLIAAAGLLLLLPIGREASYAADVFPGVMVFAVGLTLLVAPLTTTVLAAAPTRQAGIASGINNAVARTASLLAVAALPPIVGIGGADFADPDVFSPGFRLGMVVCAFLLVCGGVVAGVLIRNNEGSVNAVD
ncbi:MAG: hypothetical protein ACXWYB_05090 [Aeromicrobium sp.]